MHRPEPYGSAESRRLYPLIVQEGFVVSIDGSPVSDGVFCDFRGRRSRVQQIGGDAACQGRAVQRAQVSLRLSNYMHTQKKPTILPIYQHRKYMLRHAFTVCSREERSDVDLMHVFHSSLCRLYLHVSA